LLSKQCVQLIHVQLKPYNGLISYTIYGPNEAYTKTRSSPGNQTEDKPNQLGYDALLKALLNEVGGKMAGN